MELKNWVRPNILLLEPYSSARNEFRGEARALLDANENPFNHPLNRYPDPLQRELKSRLAFLKGTPQECLFLGNGSDEPIDLLIRVFCEPAIHSILLVEPTYGMYRVAAGINNVAVTRTLLNRDFQPDEEALLAAVTPQTRLIFLCSPNNPTGNTFAPAKIEKILTGFPGPVVVDEAYSDFAPSTSWLPRLAEFRNLIVLQTLSKAWGLASLRLGMAFAHPYLISLLTKIKYPYNLSTLTQQKALKALSSPEKKDRWVARLIRERTRLTAALQQLPFVEKVWPSDANFLLVKMTSARKIYLHLANLGIVVRDRSAAPLCENSLRITVGTPAENRLLVKTLQEYRQHG